MSIQQNVTLDNGIIIPEAYIIIGNININYIEQTVSITAVYYYNVSIYQSGFPEVITINYKCNSDEYGTYFSELILKQLNKSLLSQAESFLLNLPSFNGAVQI